jgi:enterochelin esterase-like enzyme
VIPRSFYTSAVATEHYLGMRWPRAIWRAVLEQAIADIVSGPSWAEMRNLSLREAAEMRLAYRQAAEDWVADEENEPRRFVWVCEQLGLEPAAVRKSIAEKLSASA